MALAAAWLAGAAPCRTVKICAAQPPSMLVDYRLGAAEALAEAEKRLDRLEKMVHRAGGAGCDVLAFPEDSMGLLHWEAGDPEALKEVMSKAVPRMLERLGKAAESHNMYLVCSSDTVDGRGVFRNSAFFLSRGGKEIGRYHKVNPTVNESARTRGDSFLVFETPHLGGWGC